MSNVHDANTEAGYQHINRFINSVETTQASTVVRWLRRKHLLERITLQTEQIDHQPIEAIMARLARYAEGGRFVRWFMRVFTNIESQSVLLFYYGVKKLWATPNIEIPGWYDLMQRNSPLLAKKISGIAEMLSWLASKLRGAAQESNVVCISVAPANTSHFSVATL